MHFPCLDVPVQPAKSVSCQQATGADDMSFCALDGEMFPTSIRLDHLARHSVAWSHGSIFSNAVRSDDLARCRKSLKACLQIADELTRSIEITGLQRDAPLIQFTPPIRVKTWRAMHMKVR